MVKQGEIYDVYFEDGGRRPAVIVSADHLNQGSSFVVVTFTSSDLERRRQYPTCVSFRRGEFGLDRDCVAKCDSITVVRNTSLVAGPIGRLDDLTLRSVVNAIGDVIGAECEPV